MPSKKKSRKKSSGSSKSSADTPARICFDRIIPHEYAPARTTAVAAAVQSATHGGALGLLDATVGIAPPAHMALIHQKKWPNGHTLKCRFLDGSSFQRKRVEQKARIWEKYANIKLKFVASGDVDVRISFVADEGSWSAVGTDSLVESYFPKYQPTMNYGWLRDNTADEEYERVVVHEFGHALGCIHEHQQPNEKLDWNLDAVYRYFSGSPNFWSKEDIDFNVVQKYGPQGIDATIFDPASIMLYQFDGVLFKSGKGTPNNIHLSPLDKQFIAQMYPMPAKKKNK